jgi:hypothetical protein
VFLTTGIVADLSLWRDVILDGARILRSTKLWSKSPPRVQTLGRLSDDSWHKSSTGQVFGPTSGESKKYSIVSSAESKASHREELNTLLPVQ